MSSPENEENCEQANAINQDLTGRKAKELVATRCSPNDATCEQSTENSAPTSEVDIFKKLRKYIYILHLLKIKSIIESKL